MSRTRPPLLLTALLATALAALAGCGGGGAPAQQGSAPTRTIADSNGSASHGAISTAQPAAPPTPQDVLAGTRWPAASLGEGQALVSCSTDYADDGDGHALPGLDYFQVLDALEPCRESGLLRLHYAGKIDAGFVDLMERISAMAKRMDIGQRILDIDSSGGHVEQGIRAGDVIGASGWTLWVREQATCHSACVLILAAADNRIVSGSVGIHRMMRIGSQARTRAELNTELREVHQQLADYLQRNGAAVAVADLMMTVPSRDLRLLEPLELQNFGLLGPNAVQQDLERITMLRECGADFVQRHETWVRRFERQCGLQQVDVGEKNACGRRLQRQLGFPDQRCPAYTPMAELETGNGRDGGRPRGSSQ